MGGDEHEHGRKGSGKGNAKKGAAVLVEEDQLDTEYRYWSFMEAHPGHNSLPAKAKLEAMDVLTCAWTECLLPSHRAVPGTCPFYSGRMITLDPLTTITMMTTEFKHALFLRFSSELPTGVIPTSDPTNLSLPMLQCRL